MAHVFVGDLDCPSLEPDDAHHLERVLRLRPGESVTASDGFGGSRPCHYVAGGALSSAGDIVFSPRPAPSITIAFALVKGDRPEWTVQKLTEAGVDTIVPMTTARSVVRWDGDRALRQVARLRSVARAAAMQSRQVWLPSVAPVSAFASLPSGAMAQMGGSPPSLSHPTILVGPEGGWDDSELALRLPRVGLGPTVLRAETAALAAGLLLCALRAGTVRPA